MKTSRDLFKRPFLLFFSVWLAFTAAMAQAGEAPSLFDVLSHREVVDLTLEADFDAIQANRLKDFTYPARMQFRDASGKLQTWSLKLSVRGAFRRVHCVGVPPLKLNFKKSDLEAAGLARFDDLKLVTQCLADEERAADMVLREYLCYKFFNEISPYSFRVQLLRITYKHSRSSLQHTEWAFLIEDGAQLRHRTGSDKVESERIYNMPRDSFHVEHEKIVAMFQYFIGNTDWSLASMRNLYLMKRHGKYIVVPYDFDFSGMVNAPYASANPEYQINSVRERIYLGFPEDLEDLHVAQAILLGHRPKFERLIRRFRYLSPASRRDMLQFMRKYYDSTEEVRPAERVVLTSGN
ncbi:MAG: hypothetical protein KatS3mg029_0049 [Saprospiraceae bacterium]|nr:MAG: hypothetical protein KatS3mg029_0049 [Saprospiraceae bacterium]